MVIQSKVSHWLSTLTGAPYTNSSGGSVPGNPFGNSELVLGSFKSIRLFRARTGYLTPVSFLGTNTYDRANHWFDFKCAKTVLNHDVIKDEIRTIWSMPEDIGLKLLCVTVFSDGPFYVISVDYRVDIQGMPLKNEKIPWSDRFLHEKPCVKPTIDCTCGFYSFYNFPTALASHAYWLREPTGIYYWGVVENAGTVLHGTLGLRAQRMSILGVAPYIHHDKTHNTYTDMHIFNSLARNFPVYTSLSALNRSYKLDVITL